jgi:hypothetical protein
VESDHEEPLKIIDDSGASDVLADIDAGAGGAEEIWV